MGKTRLTPRAQADLNDIWTEIATQSVSAADRLVSRVLAKAQASAEFPHMGAPRPDLSPKARILISDPYILIYEPQPDGVLVVSIVHGRRDPAHWLDPPLPLALT